MVLMYFLQIIYAILIIKNTEIHILIKKLQLLCF